MFGRNEFLRIQALDHPRVVVVKRRVTPSLAATIAAAVAAAVAILFAVSNADAAASFANNDPCAEHVHK